MRDRPVVRMLTSFYCFASDLDDRGAEAALDEMQEAGATGVTLAAAYHASRDLFPRARRSRLRFLRGGEVHFRPDPTLWRGAALQPLGGERETLGELVALAGRRGMHVDGWTVFCHVDRERDLPSGLAEETCFGDQVPTQLCPANPAVREYVVTLAREVARRGVRAVVAESLHFHGFDHGAHHERAFVRLSPTARSVLGNCFCRHCCDDDALRGAARAHVEAAFAADSDDGRAATPAILDALLPGHRARREERVSSLVAEVAFACREQGSALVFLDASGATKGYATGQPAGGPAPEVAWTMGVDVAACAHAAGAIGAIAYAADPARVTLDLAAYRELAGPDVALEAVLRPSAPDCSDSANLTAKLAACAARGVRSVGLYHYGLMPAPAFERASAALRGQTRSPSELSGSTPHAPPDPPAQARAPSP